MNVIAWSFFRHEVWTLFRSRKSQTVGLLLIYTLIAVPFILKEPPAEIVEAVKSWFNNGSTFVIFMFVWIDLALNKTITFLGALISAGIIVDERARNTLTLFLSKPIAIESYFASRALAAMTVFAWWYLLTAILGALTLPYRIEGFHRATFLALSLIHLFAGTFAVALSAAVAQSFEKKLSSLLFCMLTLSLLVGLAFLPFYDRDLWIVGALNPFFHAISIFGELDELTWGDVLWRVLLLAGWNVLALWYGIRRAAQREI